MTAGEMLGFTKRFKEIMSVKQSQQRNYRLANLMKDLEVAFNIPVLRNETFEMKNPFAIQLYRTVSMARDL